MSVRLRGLTIAYGSVVAVDDATFELPKGAVGLLGRNGAGKTSILRALLGLVRPTRGSMQILDLPPDADPREIRRRVGYMPERDCFIPGLNGFECVALAGQLSGMPERQAFRRAHEVLWLVGLEEQRYRAVAGYSTGMRQKVKFGTALVHDPDVLFLDEPTNGLDPRGRVEMLDLVQLMARDLGKSVVLSSHILQDVERTCSDVVLMEGGRVLAAGPVSDLTKNARRTFHVGVEGCDAQALALRLRGDGVVAASVGERGLLQLDVVEGFEASTVFAAVSAAGGVVRRLVEHRRSLEDVFLGAVAAGSGAPAAETV
ncbi:MAG: ABC transporter ATP-binding protein [Planctomycetota bacterium]